MVGGVGYLVSTFVSYVFPNADLVAGLLTVPATIGEIWIIGYLIIFGVREHARPDRGSARVATTGRQRPVPLSADRAHIARAAQYPQQRGRTSSRRRATASRGDLRLCRIGGTTEKA